MNDALWPLRMKVVSANAASPSGAGSATGRAAAGVVRVSSSTAIACLLPSLLRPRVRGRRRGGTSLSCPQIALRLNRGERLRLQVVRVVREQLGAVRGDQRQILEPAAAEPGAVETRLERDHVALHELARVPAEPRLLVHFEADAMAEAVEEAFLEDLAFLLVEAGRVARRVEDLAREDVHVAPGHAGLAGRERPLERLV